MILVSILGDFHSSFIPIFFEFKDKLTYHIILHDDSAHDKKQSKKIIDGQIRFLKNNEKKFKYKLLDLTVKEDDYTSILNAFKIILSKSLSPKDIYLNATDGLSSLGLILSDKVINTGGKVISYNMHDNTYHTISSKGMKNKSIKKSTDIISHLLLKGYKIKAFTSTSTMKERKADKIYKDQFYWLIKDNLNVDDIMANIEIEFENKVTNKIDILIMKNNHLHMVQFEYAKIKSTSIYYIDSLMDLIDDEGKCILLVKNSKCIPEAHRYRAKANRIDILEYSRKSNTNQIVNKLNKIFDDISKKQEAIDFNKANNIKDSSNSDNNGKKGLRIVKKKNAKEKK